jgi:energy-coupling factor transporter ATP-binding protein EcfA2
MRKGICTSFDLTTTREGWHLLGHTPVMLLRVLDLVVRHHPSHPPVLAGVGLEVAAGELVAVVGANGSGKSTLGRALAGLEPIESGHVVGVDGRAPRVGLVLQDPAAQLVSATTADEIALGPQAAGMLPVAVDGRARTTALRHRLGAVWARDPGALSGGQQQRVAIASIDACDVDVLVLDEPTAMLDEPARAQLVEELRELANGRGVVWITQVADEVAACDRVVILDAGVVVWSGAIDEYVADPARAATFDLDLPVAARVAHDLAARGMWPSGVAIPSSTERLADVLVGDRNGDADA